MTIRGVGGVVGVDVGVESAEGVGGTLGGVKMGIGAGDMVGVAIGITVELMGVFVEVGGSKVLTTWPLQLMVKARVIIKTSVEI